IFDGLWKEGLEKIAEKHKASIAQIAIAWGLARDVIMIPKSTHKDRIIENYESKDILLSIQEVDEINSLNRGKRVYTDPDNSPWGLFVK
ncbi:MAG: aldo/keto reductase, partial [Acholeplasmataceae bacterium]|nr:aldo/keto reductase [Acholeplasmataceae bacterium]